jgi:hypothetical protein
MTFAANSHNDCGGSLGVMPEQFAHFAPVADRSEQDQPAFSRDSERAARVPPSASAATPAHLLQFLEGAGIYQKLLGVPSTNKLELFDVPLGRFGESGEPR